LAIQFEEKDLIREHGAAYTEYRQKVPMLLPIGKSGGVKITTAVAGMEGVVEARKGR
jgi:hypothetical protein